MKRKLIAATAGAMAITAAVIAVAGRAGAGYPAWHARGQLVMNSNGVVNTGLAMKVVFHAPAKSIPVRK
jgi:hypothetical protein